jgi:hypothetical protein
MRVIFMFIVLSKLFAHVADSTAQAGGWKIVRVLSRSKLPYSSRQHTPRSNSRRALVQLRETVRARTSPDRARNVRIA